MTRQSLKTSWEEDQKWYDTLVGSEGHYYHQRVVLPGVLKLLAFSTHEASLLDLGCGQGILARALPHHISYQGVDLSPGLIASAKKLTKRKACTFSVQDICTPFDLKRSFTHAALLLAAQNLERPDLAFQNASAHLVQGGYFVIVLNHPCFRIPRQSHWEVDEKQKLQYRRIDRYMTPLKIPIQMHPGKTESSTTWSFHHPLSDYTKWLLESGFMIESLEEWISDKKSTGKNAKMENRARAEFPLFLAIKARKR